MKLHIKSAYSVLCYDHTNWIQNTIFANIFSFSPSGLLPISEQKDVHWKQQGAIGLGARVVIMFWARVPFAWVPFFSWYWPWRFCLIMSHSNGVILASQFLLYSAFFPLSSFSLALAAKRPDASTSHLVNPQHSRVYSNIFLSKNLRQLLLSSNHNYQNMSRRKQLRHVKEI